MLSYVGLLMLCLSVTADDCFLFVRSGENLTVECSTAGCVNSLSGMAGVYLYRDEVDLTFLNYEPSKDGNFFIKAKQYEGRVKKTGSFENHRITISNMTVHDSGLYRCIFYHFKEDTNTECNTYKVVVSEDSSPVTSNCPTNSSTNSPSRPEDKSCPAPILVILITATVSVLITMIFTLCIIPKVNKRKRRGGEPRATRVLSNDYVYEVMTRNGFQPFAEPTA